MKPPFIPDRRGFTLLEVLIAVAILGMMTLTLYQFVDTTLRAAAFSQKSGAQDAAFAGLRRLLAAQLAAMPTAEHGTMIGITMTRGGERRDLLQMLCPAGNALLAPDASGFYQTTFDLHEIPRGSGHYTLGLEREPWSEGDEDDDNSDDDDKPRASARNATDTRPGHELARVPGAWIKLMDGVRGLEFDYFDSRINSWVDKWTDAAALPNLVRLRLTVDGLAQPYEIVLRVPAGGARRAIPTAFSTNPAASPANGSPVPGTNRASQSYVPPGGSR